MSAPLVVNTNDGTVWTRRAATRAGEALYSMAGVDCPEMVMATLAELAEHGIVGSADVLPMPVSPEPQAPMTLQAARVRLAQYGERTSTWSTATYDSGTERALHEIAQTLLAEVNRLEAERHSTNEALDDAVQELREREQRDTVVAEFVAQRAEYITAIRNCHPDNGHDYDRWQGHAAARRQLAELLGLPVAWPAEDPASVGKSADKLAALLAPTQALQEDTEPLRGRALLDVLTVERAERAHNRRLGIEDPHDSPLRHEYRVGRDLPETGGARRG